MDRDIYRARIPSRRGSACRRFPTDSPLSRLDEIGRDLPSLLEDEHFRTYARGLSLPPCPEDRSDPEFSAAASALLRARRVSGLRLHQSESQPRASSLPQNLAVPLCQACTLLRRPPILSYDGYALYNWKRFDRQKPIALGNIDTLQNFVHLYDEHWFILVHVEIEAIAARILARHCARVRPRPIDAAPQW